MMVARPTTSVGRTLLDGRLGRFARLFGFVALGLVAAPSVHAQEDKPASSAVPQLRDMLAEDETEVDTATKSDDASVDPRMTVSADEYEPPRPPTAAEVDGASSAEAMQALLESDLEHFVRTADAYGRDVRDLIKVRYAEQRDTINSRYDKRIEGLEVKERERRAEAIQRFQEFVSKYPNNPDYTPDAMFRLAELYFEKSSDTYLALTRSYEDLLVRFDAGELSEEPEPPSPDYSSTIDLYQKLIGQFPGYRHADAARYLLGYSYGEMGEDDKSLAMYVALVEKHPTSKFLPEVHTRIGEIFFDQNSRQALEKSIYHYSQVLPFKDSPYYDKALYKLAWAHYRLDAFDEAVSNFVALVDFADEQKRLTGRSGSELRAEALQYIAISLADEKWGGIEKAKRILGDLGDRDFIGEMWKRYGEILFDQTRYPLAIEVLRTALRRYPDAPYNPEVQAKIVAAYERQRDFDNATKAREELVARYGEGGRWFEKNKDDKAAIARAQELTERSVYTAAIYNHQQAQAYKQSNRLSEARRSYRRAAAGYETYLNNFPEAKNAYEFRFYLAECLYYSDAFAKAAEQYGVVRDSNADNKHLESAALSSVISLEKEVERLEGSGKLEKLEFQKASERADRPIVAKDIAPVRKSLVQASDRFIEILPKSERVPAVAYRAAEVFYKHDQHEEARRRFEWIVSSFPNNEVARFSANLIIETYLAVKDWDNVEKWSQQLASIAEKSGGDAAETEKLVANLKKFKVGAQFKKAEAADAAGDFETAAATYVALVDSDPKNEFADKALYNAAIDYEKLKRFDAAATIYQRIYTDYPKSSLASRALFRTGVNAEKGFDFPGAINAYTKLVERYPESEHRADALYNVAVTLEKMQQYGQAAQAFARYSTTFPSRDDAAEMFFRSALVYEKMQAWTEAIQTFRQFIKSYKSRRSEGVRIVRAYKKIGDSFAAVKKSRDSVRAYRDCVSEYDRRGYGPRDKASAYAGKCAFEIAEDEFRAYDSIRLAGTGKKQVKSLTIKAKKQRLVEKAYSSVFRYKRVETTLAALYRIGFTYERFAESLFNAEIPPEFKNKPELADEYKLQLEQKAEVLERKAERAYRKAYDEAIKTKVANAWTQRIREGLNKYQPDEFPVQKEGLPALQTFTISGHGLDTLGDAEPRKAKASGGSASAGGR